jgi:hypothetical protein
MFKMQNKDKLIAIAILIIVGVSYRFFKHPPNFTPLAAISLFSGFYFRRYFVLIPIFIMIISDIFIGFYDWRLMAAVYLSLALISFAGVLMRKKSSVIALVGFSLSGSVLFFLITNFAVWLFGSWYAHDFSGLTQCYLMAIPFFKNTVAGDLFYLAAIFGAYELLARPKERLSFLPASSK